MSHRLRSLTARRGRAKGRGPWSAVRARPPVKKSPNPHCSRHRGEKLLVAVKFCPPRGSRARLGQFFRPRGQFFALGAVSALGSVAELGPPALHELGKLV